MICEGLPAMQISTASLLTAQQARVPSQPQAARTAAPKSAETAAFQPASFEPLSFVQAPAANQAAPAPQPQPAFVRPGSQIDIRI
jgi:hypothetical protein